MLGKTTTPSKKIAKTAGSSGGSGSKKKQQSLMSFFKPASKPSNDLAKENKKVEINNEKSNIPPSSSPLKAKSNATSYKDGSDKENDDSMMDADETKFTDTPLTSESDANVTLEETKKPSMPHSSPIDRSKKSNDKPSQSSPLSKRRSAAKKVSYAESDSEEEDISVAKKSSKKRKRVVDSDSEAEDDFKPADDGEDDDDMSDFVVDDNDDMSVDDAEADEEDYDDKPKKSNKKAKKSSPPPPKSTSSGSSDNLANKFKANSSYTSNKSFVKVPNKRPSPTVGPFSGKPNHNSFQKENEERYQWLVDIKDSEKRPITHPEYDSRTLFIPSSAWTKFTPFEKQYWEIKSTMWDTVVFFKKGKFYELYENDAMIANTEFDLKIAGGGRANMKLAGIPEMSFEYWAKEFISHGYKVAKVDQKETLLAKEMRGGSTKEEKIIKRELTAVLTGGTLTDLDMISDDMAIYCLSIKEESLDDGSKTFGVAFVDTATSEMNFIELHDDQECTKLDTLITQVKPKEILCEKNNLCSTAVKILKYSSHSSNQIWNNLNPYSEFWDYDSTLENLVENNYYDVGDDFTKYPKLLTKLKDSHKIAFNAFGGLLYYLKSLKLDESVMTLANFNEYDISKGSSGHMLLDGITLNNLEILNNSFDGGDQGTLFKLLNRSITPFGKRVLKHWILHPLMNVNEINERYNSIEYLMNENPEFRVSLECMLTGLPDLERLLARVHSKTLRFKDFVKVVESFEKIAKSIKELQSFSIENSGLIEKAVKSFPPEMIKLIADWEDSFDRQEATNDIVVPAAGVDEEFDDSSAKMSNLENQLNEYLKEYKKTFKSHEICFKDSGKEIFLIEIPTKIKNIPKDWQQMGSTSKVKRYWSPEVRVLVRELLEQKELHKMICENLRFKMYERFDANYQVWMSSIKSLATIDCIVALTKTSETMGYPSCRPEFISSDHGFIEFKELRHPCFFGNKEFIPNDVCLGGEKPNFGLLTGANAAGKSTMMRTTSLAVILSQIGCYIPASLAKLNPIDKIMTRLGANDNIMQGKSTFFVELSETKKILTNATANSLVILDELGRGGSSSDGYAIAEAVLHQLSTHVQPLGFFATHYGSLGLSFTNHPQIKPLRMGILADSNSRNITFLYKLEEGSAPGSFGMSVASMCGISSDIVDNAEVAAKKYEQTSKLKQDHDRNQTNNLSLGLQSDFSCLAKNYESVSKDILRYNEEIKQSALKNIFSMIENL
ncbi:mismatch repair ATPase MSH6 [Hyphopichia burtonii NRRL Y-1933]|uniref:DNA mismatch repair protein n=1 Tax=Hyphopichia burtonii NRRL Y-1933 TaxID=984485 RepID=A0A1E4RIK2_9ASCO|nr:mismatch repair ATPase MSH6 [Hyphopichia burtonii NRRL Y-1933]ODV67102.1 mismatch repair ATPase MSH6 [Hyphopichia burtonii NRRL Y-1933]